MSKPRLTNSDYCRAANQLGCEPAAIKAVAEQESLGAGFDANDRPKILFERHLFHRLTNGKYDASHPGISNRTPGGYGSSASQYGRFSEAFDLNPRAAMMSASWGRFQILGSNFGICGYPTVDDFVDAMKDSEAKQLDAFCEFVLHNGLDDELTNHNWAGFARGYNGPKFRINQYDIKIAAGYRKYSKENIDCGKIPATTAINDGNPIPPQPLITKDQSDPNSTDTANTASADTAPDLSGDTPPITQTAETIVNTGDIPAPAVATEEVTLVAPPSTGAVAASTKMTIAGIAVPSCLVAVFKAISNLVTDGYIDAKDIGNTVLSFITNNTKYVLALVGLVIVLVIIKRVTMRITLWLSMLTHAIPSWNSITVVPSETPPIKKWWQLWR